MMLFLSLVLAAPPQAPRPPQAPALALASAERKPVPQQEPAAEYARARAEAIRRNVPLVVYVSYVPKERWEGPVFVSVQTFPGVESAGCVVGIPDGRGGLDRYDVNPYGGHGVVQAAVRRLVSPGPYSAPGASSQAAPSASPRFFFRGSRGGGSC